MAAISWTILVVSSVWMRLVNVAIIYRKDIPKYVHTWWNWACTYLLLLEEKNHLNFSYFVLNWFQQPLLWWRQGTIGVRYLIREGTLTNLGIFLSKNLRWQMAAISRAILVVGSAYSCHYWSQALAQWDFCRGMMYRMEGWTSVTWSQNSSHPLCIRIWEHRCHCPACQLDCTPRTSTWSKLRMLSMLLLQKIIQISHTAQYAKLLLKCRGSNAFVICNVSSYDKWKIMPSNYLLGLKQYTHHAKWRLFTHI